MRHGRRSAVHVAQLRDEWKIARIPLSKSLVPTSAVRIIRVKNDGGVSNTPVINVNDEVHANPWFSVITNSCRRPAVRTFEKARCNNLSISESRVFVVSSIVTRISFHVCHMELL